MQCTFTFRTEEMDEDEQTSKCSRRALHAAVEALRSSPVRKSAIRFPSFVGATKPYVRLDMSTDPSESCSRSGRIALAGTESQITALEAGLDECALSLCQSVAYISGANHCSCGILACSGPLYLAAKWSKAQGAVPKLAWTLHVRDFLERDHSLKCRGGTLQRLLPLLFLYWILPNFLEVECG